MSLIVKSDVPRTTLHLAWTGPPPYLLPRILVTFLIAGLAYASPVVLIFAAFIFFILALVRKNTSGYWSDLHWDGLSTQVFLRQSGIYLWGWRNYKIPFSRMKSVRMTIGPPPKKDLEIQMSIEFEPEPTKNRHLEFTFSVKDLDQRAEAMELLFRIAKILQWDTYVVERSDPRALVVLISTQRSLRGAQPVPLEGTNLDFESDSSLQRFQEPETRVDPFVPGHFFARPKKVKHELEWSPGRSIRIASSALQFKDVWFKGLNPAIVTGILVGVLLPIFSGVTDLITFSPGNRLFFVIAFVAAAIAFSFRVWSELRKEPQREMIFDWNNLEATIRRGKAVRSFPFQQIREIVFTNDEGYVPGSGSKHSGGRSRGYALYGARVLIVHDNGEDEIVKTVQFPEDKDSPYLMALPLVVELARALSVPYRWLPSAPVSRRFIGVRLALSLLSVFAVLGGIVYIAGAPTFDLVCQPREMEAVVVILSEAGELTTGRSSSCTVIPRSGIGRGFKQPVQLSCIGLPHQFECVFSTNPVGYPYTEGSELTVLSPRDAIAQQFVVEVQGDSKSHSATDRLTVTVKR